MTELQNTALANLQLLYPDVSISFKHANLAWDQVVFNMCKELDPVLVEGWEQAGLVPPLAIARLKQLQMHIFKYLESIKRSGKLPAVLIFRKSDIQDQRGDR